MSESELPSTCPDCKSDKKNFRLYTMFGGFWKVSCVRCGGVVKQGNGDAPEGVRST